MILFDYQAVRNDLNTLFAAASVYDGWQKDQTGTFIKVGEYGLALDGIAYAYLANHVSMPASLYQVFDKLAAAMDLNGDPELQGVADIRKAHLASPA